MPCSQAQRALQRVVVGCANAVELVDAAIVRERTGSRSSRAGAVLTELVEVQQDRKLTALTPHVSNLPHSHAVPETLLDVKVVVVEVRRAKILADGENIESRRTAVRVGETVASHAGGNRVENIRVGLPSVRRKSRSIGGIRGNRGR